MGNIGVITEQGDLGFGFDLLNKKDEQVYTEAQKRQQNNDSTDNQNTSVINE